MDIVFDRGSRDSPKGHALLYFRSSSEPEAVWVTYVVILPISVDVSKYVPPFLMNQVAELGPTDLSAFAFPPAPERLDSYAMMEVMADRRDDDVLYGGAINPEDVASGMMSINEAVHKYADLYGEVVGVATSGDQREEGDDGGLGVNEVLYGLMSDGDKLSELTKLVGRLRFSLDGAESNLVTETEEEIDLLSRHLPQNHNIAQLVAAVKSGDKGASLADLYLQRCFHLVREEYGKVSEAEERIRQLEDEGASEEG